MNFLKITFIPVTRITGGIYPKTKQEKLKKEKGVYFESELPILISSLGFNTICSLPELLVMSCLQ